jgi:hypothetical protein
MRPSVLSSLLASLALPSFTHAADLALVTANTPPLPIIVDAGAPPRTHDAAVTLADYIEKISGQRPAVMKAAPQTMPEHAIWIGVSPAVKALFPKADLDFHHPEETLILADENHLVIAGRDRWDPDHMEAKGRLAMKTDMQQEYGTANAVYSFIQDQLGVRWLWPNEEDVIACKSISVAPCEIRHHPTIRARGGMLQKLSLGDTKEGVDELWARWQRVQLNSMETSGGHGFGDWFDRYYRTRPEFFAASPDGSRPPGSV